MTVSQSSDRRAVLGVLDEPTCLALLRWEVVGRLAFATPGTAPTVVPVNFRLDGAVVLFRTDDGSALAGLAGQAVSLQVDRFDLFRRTGWSVLVRGVVEEAAFEPAVAATVEPWAPGAKHRLFRITPVSITGRRVELVQSPLDDRGYL
jgi:uncharacterized protein